MYFQTRLWQKPVQRKLVINKALSIPSSLFLDQLKVENIHYHIIVPLGLP